MPIDPSFVTEPPHNFSAAEFATKTFQKPYSYRSATIGSTRVARREPRSLPPGRQKAAQLLAF